MTLCIYMHCSGLTHNISSTTSTCTLAVAATAFYKEQPVLHFLRDVLGDGGGGGRGGGRGGGYGGGRGGRGGGRQGSHGGDGSVPHTLSYAERQQFNKEIKGKYIIIYTSIKIIS